jgi:glycerol-3-phosphate dehydrogenase (NAD(P)+)
MEYETTLVNTVAIIGAGAWGTAVAKSIAEARPQVTVRIWAHEKSVVSSINRRGENKFLPGIKLPRNVTAYAVLPEALEGAEAVLIASPSRFLYETALRMARHVTPRMHIGFLTKGFCKVQGKILTISQAIERAIPQLQDRVVAVSGPSHAEEVSRGFHTCLNVASRSAVSRAIIC